MGRYQKYTPKLKNIAKQKTALLSIWNDLPQQFIDKAILLFWKRQIMCCCSSRTLWTLSLNTEMAADIHHWNIWIVDEKVVQSLTRYYWIFRTRMHVHLKKWTLNFKLLYLLNHTCYFNKICRYMASILTCKRCKFGEKICYNARDIEFFIGETTNTWGLGSL